MQGSWQGSRSSPDSRRAMGQSSARTRCPAEPSAGAGAAAPGRRDTRTSPGPKSIPELQQLQRASRNPQAVPHTETLCIPAPRTGQQRSQQPRERRGGRGTTFTRKKCSLYTSARKQRLQSAQNQLCAINKTAPK